jgi:hypothetical protein
MIEVLALPCALVLCAAAISVSLALFGRWGAVPQLHPPAEHVLRAEPPEAPSSAVQPPESVGVSEADHQALHQRVDALRGDVARLVKERDAARSQLTAELNGGSLRREILDRRLVDLRSGKGRYTAGVRCELIETFEDERQVRELRDAAEE